MEARHEKRYEVDGNAEVMVGTQGKGSSLLRGRILDISTAGCYIQTLAPLAVKRDTPVYIEFTLFQQFFRIRASSKFAQSRVGIGFTFIDMDAATRENLYVLIEIMRSKVVEHSADGTRGYTRKKAG